MLQMYGSLLGIYAIPNLHNYKGEHTLTQSGTALSLSGKDSTKMENSSLMLSLMGSLLSHPN